MIFYIIFTLIIVFIITYLFSIIVLNLIDKKLNNINVTLPNNFYNIEKFENNKQKNEENEDDKKDNQKDEKSNDEKSNWKKNDNQNILSKVYNANVSGFNNNEPEFKGWEVEKKKTQTCIKNHSHNKKGRDTNCTYGVTNFMDPKEMSPVDFNIFVLSYPNNMTLQDYINWLYCYIGKENQLPYNHLRNLERLKLGKELVQEEGVLPPPGYYFPSTNAKDYFNKLYNETNEFNIAFPLNSSSGPLVGYNYNNYTEFVQNSDLYGRSGKLRNDDIGLKKNARELYNYVNPRNSNNIDIDNENEIYRIKKNEI
jgi:hypothetical protein